MKIAEDVILAKKVDHIVFVVDNPEIKMEKQALFKYKAPGSWNVPCASQLQSRIE